MRRSRHIIAIVVLASALAADGTLVTAANVEQPTMAGTFAGRLVQRISVGLRRTIRTPYTPSIDSVRAMADIGQKPLDAMIRPTMVLPFQFRLPPPAV